MGGDLFLTMDLGPPLTITFVLHICGRKGNEQICSLSAADRRISRPFFFGKNVESTWVRNTVWPQNFNKERFIMPERGDEWARGEQPRRVTFCV